MLLCVVKTNPLQSPGCSGAGSEVPPPRARQPSLDNRTEPAAGFGSPIPDAVSPSAGRQGVKTGLAEPNPTRYQRATLCGYI